MATINDDFILVMWFLCNLKTASIFSKRPHDWVNVMIDFILSVEEYTTLGNWTNCSNQFFLMRIGQWIAGDVERMTSCSYTKKMLCGKFSKVEQNFMSKFQAALETIEILFYGGAGRGGGRLHFSLLLNEWRISCFKLTLTLFRNGIFGAALFGPPSAKSVTYLTMMKLGTVMPYLKKI